MVTHFEDLGRAFWLAAQLLKIAAWWPRIQYLSRKASANFDEVFVRRIDRSQRDAKIYCLLPHGCGMGRLLAWMVMRRWHPMKLEDIDGVSSQSIVDIFTSASPIGAYDMHSFVTRSVGLYLGHTKRCSCWQPRRHFSKSRTRDAYYY